MASEDVGMQKLFLANENQSASELTVGLVVAVGQLVGRLCCKSAVKPIAFCLSN